MKNAVRMVAFVVAPTVVALVGCRALAPSSSAGQVDPAPETIYYNGKIVTANDRFDIAQALGVREGRIVAVGSNESVRARASSATRLVDLGGKAMLPGFNDNHIHMGLGGDTDVQDWEEVKTFDDLAKALKERAAATPKGEWIRGNLTRPYWPNDKVPSRWDLDKVVPDHPVSLVRGHLMIVNSLALAKAGITKDSRDPKGGWIIRNAAHEPVGSLFEDGAKRLVTRVLPKRPPLTDEQARANLRDALAKLMPLGYTSLNVPGMRPDELRIVQDVYARWGEGLPRMTLQVRITPGYDLHDDLQEGIATSIKEIEALSFHTGFGDDRLKIGAIKMSIDGGLSAPDFWTIQPYDGRPDFRGVVRIPDEALYRVGKRAHDLGWQLGVHAIGDAAVEMAVNVLDRILKESPRANHRHYLHHVSMMPPEDTLKKMAADQILVASQPAFTYYLGPFAVEALDGAREQLQNPGRTLVSRGIKLSYGTDGAPTDARYEMWTAVTRKGWDGKVYGPDEAVTVEEAIRFQTMGTAYLNFDELKKGSLEVGKYADMVVLGEDILTVPHDRIKDIPIEMTILNGKVLYSAARPTSTSSAER